MICQAHVAQLCRASARRGAAGRTSLARERARQRDALGRDARDGGAQLRRAFSGGQLIDQARHRRAAAPSRSTRSRSPRGELRVGRAARRSRAAGSSLARSVNARGSVSEAIAAGRAGRRSGSSASARVRIGSSKRRRGCSAASTPERHPSRRARRPRRLRPAPAAARRRCARRRPCPALARRPRGGQLGGVRLDLEAAVARRSAPGAAGAWGRR